MANITFDRRNINDSLQNKYILPTYQREYKWTEKQFRELITDLQSAFLDNYEPNHGRIDVGSYEEYFLGTIITSDLPNGHKSIIDGQQRLVTLTLLLSYFQRKRSIIPTLSLANVDILIRRELYGVKNYNLSFEGPRAALFDLILDGSLSDDELSAQVHSISDLDRSSEILFDLFTKIEYYLDNNLVNSLLPFFADYVVNKVMLFEIGVPSEQDAHRVFVTMNDRGLKLGPIDLLKGYLLSNILDNEANLEAHNHWMETINLLKKIGSEEDSQFIKTWLRALYADSIRGKKRGDPAGDYEIVGDSYHRWIVDNRNRLGLNTSDDFQSLISEDIPKYAKLYLKIKEYESNFKASFQHVFYNGARNLTLQPMLILSSIAKSDTEAIINKKIRAVSIFLDIIATARVLNGQDNTYDNVRDILFSIVKKIRGKDFAELKDVLKSEVTAYSPFINNISSVTYDDIKRQDLLYLLARIAVFIESVCNQTNAVGFSTYINRDRSTKTFDIEHLLCTDPSVNRTSLGEHWDFESDPDYRALRNSIGGLVLLPRGRNRSLRDKAYCEKLQVYSTENILCQTLCSGFFQNNPTASEAFLTHQIETHDFPFFNKEAVQARATLYKNIASILWNDKQLDDI